MLTRGALLRLRYRLTALALAILYPILLLFPFGWDAPGTWRNAATWDPEGGITFTGRAIALSDSPPGWVPQATRSQALDIDLRVRPTDTTLTGPARILTVSAGVWRRNVTVGQEWSDLVVRLRTPASDTNGMPNVRVPHALPLNRWVDIRIQVRPAILRIWVDGQLRIARELPQRPLAGWDPSYRVALGNELTYDRPWVGSISRAVVEAGGTRIDYATEDGGLQTPSEFWEFHRMPRLVPFVRMEPADVIANVLLFLPLGLLLGTAVAERAARWRWYALLFASGMSFGFEVLQLFIPQRQPSVDDVIANTLGAALGIWWVASRRSRRMAAGQADHEAPSGSSLARRTSG